MVLKNLLRRKARTLLTTIGIAIGVAAIVALGALSKGLVAGYGSLSGGSGADLLIAQEDAIDIVFSSVDEEVGTALAALPGVRQVSGMVYTLAATDGVPYFVVFGHEPAKFAIQHFKIIAGKSLPAGESLPAREGPAAQSGRRGGRPLILGRAAADNLEVKVGDAFRLYENVFRVVGIYETGEPIEDGAAVVLLQDAQSMSGHPRQVNVYMLKLERTQDTERIRQRIEKRFSDVTVTTSSNFVEQQEMLAYMDGFTWGVSLLAVLIGGVGVMNTMLMSVFERTREFGALRAVGWRPRQVLGLVLGESLALSGLGGLVGAGIGVAMVLLIKEIPAVSGFLIGSFSPILFAQGIGVALMLGLIGGTYPAWRASRMMPAEAMRAEGGADTRPLRVPRSFGKSLGGPHETWGRSGHANPSADGGTARVKRVRIKRARTGAAPLPRPLPSGLRSVLRQRTRTLLTVIGIGIAIMAIVSLGALTDGFIVEVNKFTSRGGAHLVGIEADASMDLSTIDENVVRRIAALPGVEAAEGFLTGYASVGNLPFFIVFGYHPRGRAIDDFTIVEGEPLAANRQIIIGRVAADNLEKQVGQTLRVFDTTFRIIGIYETGVPFEDGGGVISLRDAQMLFGQPRKVSFLGVRLTDPNRSEEVRREIEARFPEVAVSPTSDFAEEVSDMQAMRASTWAISLLALLVGGAGMTNTMVMSVFERTREIGVLRALGWRKRRVLWMIMRESVALSLLGGVAGLVAGIVVSALLNLIPFMSGFARTRFSFALLAQALVIAISLGAIGGLYPAWRAARLQPVEALRYE